MVYKTFAVLLTVMLCVSPAYAINFGEDAFDRTNRVTTARENGFFDKDFVKPSVDLEKFGHREDITVMHEGISSAIDKFKSDIADASGSPEQVKQAVQTLTQTIKDLVSAFRPDKAVKEAAQSVKPAHSGMTFMYDVYQKKGHDRPKESKTDVTKPVVGGTPQSCGYSWDDDLQGWVGPSDDSPFVPAGDKPEWDKFIPDGDKDGSISALHEGITAAMDKLREALAAAAGSPEQMKEAVQAFTETIKDLVSAYHPDKVLKGAAKSGKPRSLVDVAISDDASGDGNVRWARVVERKDAVYGIVMYGWPLSDAASDHKLQYRFFGPSKVEFTGIAAGDIESVALNYVEGELKFEVTKTDGTVVVYDAPERKIHGRSGREELGRLK